MKFGWIRSIFEKLEIKNPLREISFFIWSFFSKKLHLQITPKNLSNNVDDLISKLYIYLSEIEIKLYFLLNWGKNEKS